MHKVIQCQDVIEILSELQLNQLPPKDKLKIEEHLLNCQNCREDYKILEAINREEQKIHQANSVEMASIDWGKNAWDICSHILQENEKPVNKVKNFQLNFKKVPFLFNWRIAMTMMASVFLMGISLGYLLFHSAPKTPSFNEFQKPIALRESPLNRMEKVLNKKEVMHYFNQSQLVLTDVMSHCNVEDSFSMNEQVNINRVKALLRKSHYFKNQLNNPQMLSSAELLEKIEWLLHEVLMTTSEKESSCQKLQKLQDFIKKEKLLLKIRLVEKEVSLSEV